MGSGAGVAKEDARLITCDIMSFPSCQGAERRGSPLQSSGLSMMLQSYVCVHVCLKVHDERLECQSLPLLGSTCSELGNPTTRTKTGICLFIKPMQG